MSDYEKSLQDRIDDLSETLRGSQQAIADFPEEVRAAHEDVLRHLELVLGYAGVVLARTDGVLVSSPTVSAMDSALSKVRDQIHANPQAGTAWADEVLELLARLPAAKGLEAPQAVTEAAADFHRSAGQRLKLLEAQIDEARADLAHVTGRLQDAKAEVDLAFVERRAEADKLVTEMRSAVEDVRSRVRAAETEQAEIFRRSQEGRAETFKQRLEDLSDDFEVERARARDDAADVVREMKTLEARTRELVGIIGDLGTGGRYGVEVKAQKDAADQWRAVTVAVVVVAAGVALWATRGATNIDDPAFVSKLVIALTLGGLAAYTAKQSSRHRLREESARALELDMAAFPAFIQPMPDEKQYQAREKMFDLSFGRPLVPDGHDHGGGPSIVDQVVRRRGLDSPPDDAA